MEMILFKPNPIIEGVFGNSNIRDFNVFNKILCDLQIQKANNEFMAIVSLEEIKKIINDVNISAPEKVQNYLNNNFREKTITWTYKDLIISVGLINSTVFDKTNMTYKITVDKEIVNLILNYDELKTGYTPLNLKLNSKSFYATRIYEYLRKWSGNKNTLRIGLYKLKELLSLEGRYNTYKDFRKRVLDPSMEEINKKFNMEISFTPIKVGNKTTAIEFNFTDNEPRHYNFDDTAATNVLVQEIEEIQDVTFEEINLISERLKESKIKIAISTINRLKEEYGNENIDNAITILCNKAKQQKITAPVKYLKGILENLDKNPKDNKIDNVKKLRFNNFEPREYDYEDLEKKLLGWHK
ncbi:replication initiation protein [Clostridium taeniosporum]|uniref:Replication initiation protein n=1 Tax=Clostridium taeniosporum TaxID=394958 RepID=A0A1D7XNX0_9CLOT|nr:replication initiation protein [Clostridium taeniosporum]AOR25035.1 replication initiation protein [Clostridium taeniosporum]